MKTKGYSILIADDHKILAEGLQRFIGGFFTDSTILIANNHKEIIKAMTDNQFDILLLDLLLGEDDSRMFINQLQKLQPNLKIIVVSSLEEKIVVNGLIQNGVHGFVGKSSPSEYIINAIKTVLKDGLYIDPDLMERSKKNINQNSSFQIVLTKREKEVLNETLKEKSIKEIADSLFISTKTVENHRANLFVKFGVNNVAGLVKQALVMGYLEGV